MAATAPRFGTIDLPRPWRAAGPLLVAAVLALALLGERPLREAAAIAAGCFAVAAAVRGVQAYRELVRVRAAVDRLLLSDPRGGEVSELVQWRAHELSDHEGRQALRRELARTIHRLDPAHLPSASPLRRGPLRAHLDLLRGIERRLADERPVAPRGILLVRWLLRDAGSPLYRESSDEELARTLSRVRGALEP
jgi:hypothetical protein